ncbi:MULTISPECIES: CU044_5270 family protein [Thermomonosporaceae]|uniref:CU044_5270 family protein n=1 Tax=Thermomonosporaceae TaxID=2012 RepID=UPI00255B04DD|nr:MULTISPECIES: CU044_5270 family protein [Thermomonosporaceae]MDL4773198.1 CU044_5270 family protein [Actinomadura xylanilytica]
MSGDVLRILAEARPAELHPDAQVDGAIREAELARAMAAGSGPERERGRGAVQERRRFRPVWGLSLAGAATAAAVAAAVVVAPGGGSEGAHPGSGTAAGGDQAGVTLNANTVLLAAADKAEGQPEQARAFWHHKTVIRQSFLVDAPSGPYTVIALSSEEEWVPGKPGGKQRVRQQDLGAKPARPADVAAWKRAGSPGTFKVRVPVSPKLKAVKTAEFKVAQGSPSLRNATVPADGKLYWLGRNVSMKQLRALPTDPARLKAELLRWYSGHDTESSSVPMKSDAWLVVVAGSLVNGSLPVTPGVRAGAFRMLAGLGSVRAIGKVRDAQGRSGTAIATTERTPNGVLEQRLIIDPATGNALAHETIVVKPAGVYAHLPAGALLGSAATIANDWTDSMPG